MSRIWHVLVSASLLSMCVSCADDTHDPYRTAEKLAIPTQDYPLAGFWKEKDCTDRYGLAIAPAENGYYSVSFCGPGGCFKPGTYRENSRIVGDPSYRVQSEDVLEVSTAIGYKTFVRCESR
jgi:hypothetical protein